MGGEEADERGGNAVLSAEAIKSEPNAFGRK
jgi:hypothetical protein